MKTTIRNILLSLSILVIAGCASTDNAGKPELANVEVENPDEVTCRTVVKTGTRIGSKVCKTNRAWAMGNRAGRNMAEDIQRRSRQSVGDPNAGG